MKPKILAAIAAAIIFALPGCTEQTTEAVAENPMLDTPVPEGMVRGTVVETMNSGGYTYVLLQNGDQQLWIAGPPTAVQAGDVMQASDGTAMTNFTSNTLGRTFDVIFFAGAMQNLSSPVVDGKDIAWVYANKADIAGQSVSLRGEVVKYNTGILGRNFLHLQDGSGDAANGSNDLTVTSTTNTAVGQTIVVTGTIVLDKDFGSGYVFPVLMEDAIVTVEP